MTSYYRWDNNILRLEVYIKAGASKTEIVGPYQNYLKIRLHAPALENRANEALVQFLTQIFDVPASAINIEKGFRSKIKRLTIKNPKTLPHFIL